jgi:hypothetical protein
MRILIVAALCAGCSAAARAPEPFPFPFKVEDPSILVRTDDGPRRQLTRVAVERAPHTVWNAFVSLVALEPYDELTPFQRPAHLVFAYDAEAQNGGHHQYFENSAGRRAQESVSALSALGLACQAAVLQQAISIWESRSRRPAETADRLMNDALQGEFEVQDSDYHRCSPTSNDGLERHLNENLDAFIVIVEAG